jgi:protein gp37
MASKSTIEWTEMTWNPVTGCTKVSQGCKNCYANRMALRLKAMGASRYKDGFTPTIHEDLVDLPKRWRKPRTIFVNSMSDLFHEDIPDSFIKRVFATMAACPQHTFQVLTKRSKRLRKLGPTLSWPSNVWMGVSVENSSVLSRVLDLASVPAKVRFLSCEPLIGPLDNLPLKDIHWVIVGGESGPGSRPMHPQWVESIQAQCEDADVSFFFKQWGGVRKHRTGRTLNGRVFDDMPPLAAFSVPSAELVQIAV